MVLSHPKNKILRVNISSKLLLHCCCGPCSTASIDALRGMGFEITAFFFNPNIQPAGEYQKRLSAWKDVCEIKSVPAIVSEDFSFVPVKGQNRCSHCYFVRLKKTSEKAKELGFEQFSSTLFISPHQNHELTKKIGEKFEGFKYFDLREYYPESRKQAASAELYNQKYCGCLESKLEAEWFRKSRREKRRQKNGLCSSWKPSCVINI